MKEKTILLPKLSATLKRLLSDNRFTYVIVLAAIASRLIHLVFFFNIRVDIAYQTIATDCFINGHGISATQVNPFNLSEVIYTPLTKWPPGYSLLLSPFYLLFNSNFVAAGLTVQVIMALVLIIVCRKILGLLAMPLHLINLCTLVNGFFIYQFYLITSSDAVTVPFFLTAVYYALKLLRQPQKQYQYAVIMLACLIAVALLKYLYMPVVFVIPLYLTATGFINKNQPLKRIGIGSFFFLLFMIAGFFLYQLHSSGAAGHISSSGRGFFPEHLLNTYAFANGAFLKPDTIESLAGIVPGLNGHLQPIWQIINLLLVIYLLYCFIRFIAIRGLRQLSLTDHFFHLSVFLSLLVVFVLALLSVQVTKEEMFPGVFWTYVEEPRYFGLITVLCQLNFFIIYKSAGLKFSSLAKTVFIFLALCLAVDISRQLIFDLNRIRKLGREEYSWQREKRFQQSVDTVIQNVKTKYPATPIIVAGTSYYYNHRMSLYSHVPILYDFNLIKDHPMPKSTNPVVVVSVVEKKQLALWPSGEDGLGNLQGEFDNFFIFSRYVPAN